MLIEENGMRVLTDPGSYTTAQNDVKNIDVVVITHEHPDHFHIESIKKILANNPNVPIITNTAVDALLKKENITYATVVEDGENQEIKGVKFSGHGTIHAEIHKEWPRVQNTGYMIGERLFYPGDAFHNPKVPVDLLVLPTGGPWVKISEAIDYAIEVAPKAYFSVHDGGLNERGLGFSRRVAPQILEKHGIKFIALEIDKETEI